MREVEEETGDFDHDGNPIIKRRKPDDEHLIRHALLDARLIDAVISLPLNVFYGAGVPACLLILDLDGGVAVVVVDHRSRSADQSESGDSRCQFSQQAAPSYLSANQVVCVKPGPMKSTRPAASLPTICQQMLPVTLCPEKMSKPLSPSAGGGA